MEKIQAEIDEVKEAIKKVGEEIDVVSKRLDGPDITTEDKHYLRQEKHHLRQEKDRLQQKEDRLRQEKDRLQQKELILLQRSSLASVPETESINLGDYKQKIDDIYEVLVKGDRATPLKTPASFGSEEMLRLKREGKLRFFPGKDGESILTPDQAKILSQQTTEHRIVAYLTPFFHAAFECHGNSTVVVNSEEYKWLKTSEETTYNQKPDMIVCHKSIYRKQEPFKSTDEDLKKMRRETDVFGRLADWKLRQFIYLVLEAKKEIDSSAVGQTLNYGAHICFNDGPVTARSVLFDTEKFWLVECVKGRASSIEKCNWTDPGSKSLLTTFALKDPMMELLDVACETFDVEAEEDGYLGQGAFGIVFKVQNQNGDSLALKLVPDKEECVADLEMQMLITNQACSQCSHLVVGIEEGGYAHFQNLGAVLLLSEVGGHYSKLGCKSIMDSLEELHDNGILHGDARVENVVCVNGRPKWIDFRSARIYGNLDRVSKSKEKELKNLQESIRTCKYYY